AVQHHLSIHVHGVIELPHLRSSCWSKPFGTDRSCGDSDARNRVCCHLDQSGWPTNIDERSAFHGLEHITKDHFVDSARVTLPIRRRLASERIDDIEASVLL